MTLHSEAKHLGWPRHPQPWQYRNPHVEKYQCIDCGTAVAPASTRCRACSRKQQSGIRPGNLNAQRVVAAVESGKFKNMACIADEVGISRERVRQILNATGNTEFGYRRFRRLEWPCPDCGVTISLRPGDLDRTIHMPAHCRMCANNYCRRGHLRSENTRASDNVCRACRRIRAKRIVEVRTCRECGKGLEISKAVSFHIRKGRSRGIFHKDCYHAYRRRRKKLSARS